MGYIAETGPWSNEYLFGAQELRNGVNLSFKSLVIKPEVYDAMYMKQLAGMIAIRLNKTKADGKNVIFRVETTDSERKGTFHLRNGVLAYLGDNVVATFTVKMPLCSLYVLASGASEELQYETVPTDKKSLLMKLLKC